jgi:putative ABC transport system permease protein
MLRDLRLAVRSLCCSPGFTLPASSVMTLSIGAAAFMFAVVDGIVLRPLPFEDSSRLVAIGEVHHRLVARGLSNLGSVAPQNFLDWRRTLTHVEALAASADASGFTWREGPQPEELRALRITANLLDALRVRPTIGRGFDAQHETAGNDRVALISHSLWRRRFGGAPDAIGTTIRVDSGTWEVVGVLPAGFEYPFGLERPPDVFVPYVAPASVRRDEDRNYNLRVIGRLKPGARIEQAREELQSVTAAIAREFPAWFEDRSPDLLSLHEATVGRVRGRMLALLAGAGFILLMACANVANLLLLRATTRARDSAIQAALGANRWQIAGGPLLEAAMLSTAATVAGLALSWLAVAVFRSWLPPALPRVAAIAIDLRVVLITAVAALAIAALAGTGPALRAARRDCRAALDQWSRSGTERASGQPAAVLVVVVVALAVVPLWGAGLFALSLWHVARVDLGFDYRRVLTVAVAPRLASADAAIDDVLARVRLLPGVESAAALAGGLPFSGSWRSVPITVGNTTFDGSDDAVHVRSVSPEYARVMRSSIVRGRYIADGDARGAPLVTVLNEHAVDRFFSGRDPLGAIVGLDGEPRVVIGVVRDIRARGPEQPVNPEAYLPLEQAPAAAVTVLVRTAGDPARLAPDVRDAVLAAVPGVPAQPTTLESQLQRLIAHRQLNTMLSASFAMMALAITALGVYGVTAYTVAQQRGEIAIRMALGALPAHVMRTVLGRAALMIVTGLALGSAAASMLAESVRAFLFAVRPYEPTVYVSVGIVLTLTGLLAAFVPARGAAAVDPIVAMRRL